MSALRVDGAAVVYRLYDVGYEIALDRALDLLAASAPERVRPVRGEAQALQIRNPPVTVILGHETVTVGDAARPVELSARIFDFGVVSLRARVDLPAEMPWDAFTAFGPALETAPALAASFAQHLRLLTERIAPAVERPALAPQTEDYVVYRLSRVLDAEGRPVAPSALRDVDVVPLLLNETRPLSEAARRELLPHRFSYYEDDLAILSWDNALVVEPRAHDTDVQFILEFANAQLLELRYYDALLDAELPRMYDRIAALRGSGRSMLRNRYAGLLAELQTQVADSTETVERAESALKVTDDVYLARVYLAALEIFRARAWRAGIDHKLAIVRETYAMLNGEAQAARAEALELAIVLLIVFEIVMAFFRPH
ncbi:hypothetical protein [Roseisolibacter sp. H3M3-2]|uniref:hypothetical protein n=1 Tax=Roseisolibacter sp. H3M3-2 TaxID=3031323 RepID=UPI0023D9B019|nr:hypothetical protein [Roseisolibacter sp. H3M3-2]MDF1503116.1 hypothetical protein [Roseisolibacter sp. H3M3-2]